METSRRPGAGDASAATRPLGRFSRSRRIRKSAEFRQIRSHARVLTTHDFVLLLHARDDSRPFSKARLGLVVSRRIGNAVRRNRYKRLLREAFRQTPELWTDDLDVVAIARPSAREPRLDEVIREWRALAPRIERLGELSRRDRARRLEALAHPEPPPQTPTQS